MNTLTLGPILFHWPADKKRDFYYRIADEAPVDTVCLGEVICSKRAPFFDRELPHVIDRLETAGKSVVLSTLAEVVLDRERSAVADLCASDRMVEANDTTALYYLAGKPHRVGPLFNAYNEKTMAYLAAHGATTFSLNPEIPGDAISTLSKSATEHDAAIEVQVYGRVNLALSARCYHARAYGHRKDNCQYVCEKHPDGMNLITMEDSPFLVVNGVQTLSFTCLNLAREIPALIEAGVSAFRLSPHDCDMVRVAGAFRALLDGRKTPADVGGELDRPDLAPFSNGFFHRTEGHRWVDG